MKRAEKRKLERRLEKLIAIHFPLPPLKTQDSIGTEGNAKERPVGASENRRISSFVDFDVPSITILDAGGLWRGIFGGDDITTIRSSFIPSVLHSADCP
jgi:rabenosyn-5